MHGHKDIHTHMHAGPHLMHRDIRGRGHLSILLKVGGLAVKMTMSQASCRLVGVVIGARNPLEAKLPGSLAVMPVRSPTLSSAMAGNRSVVPQGLRPHLLTCRF